VEQKPRILTYDLEVAPNIGSAYGMHDTNLLWMIKDWYLLSVSWKWFDEKKTHVIALNDFPKRYKKDSTDDYEIAKKMFELLEEADIAIGHNINRFDRRKANTRLLLHGFDQPAPYKQVDTLTVLRRQFAISSNSLDFACKFLGIGGKMVTPKNLWQKIIEQPDEKTWNIVKRYNKVDVIKTEKLYLRIRPWVVNHPHIGTMEGRPDKCEVCGGAQMHQHTKKTYAKRGWKYQYKCYNCGHYQLGTKLHKFENYLT
jgi:hypothetical protein